jgi:hypothetical protein
MGRDLIVTFRALIIGGVITSFVQIVLGKYGKRFKKIKNSLIT